MKRTFKNVADERLSNVLYSSYGHRRKELKLTKEILSGMSCKYYGAGKELNINDKIHAGFTINYANLYGKPSSAYNSDGISLSLKMFVEKDGMLYELYYDLKKK